MSRFIRCSSKKKRDYIPSVGRWAAEDPLGFWGDTTNFYAYATSDPVNFGGADDFLKGSYKGRMTLRVFAISDGGQPQSDDDSYPPGWDTGRGFTPGVYKGGGGGGGGGSGGGKGSKGKKEKKEEKGKKEKKGNKGVTNVVSRTKDVLGHIFRNAPGHVNPATVASQNRYIKMFESVANNSKNINANVLTNYQRTAGGFQGYSQTFRNGSQVWVQTRNGKIINAGVNLIPK